MDPIIRLSIPEPRQTWAIPVLFEDEHLLALDKPAELLTSPDRYDPNRPNLMKLLHAGIEKETGWARERQLTYLSNAHRLDFETTGVILLAKNKPSLVNLCDQFGENKPTKRYLALIKGFPPDDEFEVKVKLAPDPNRPGYMRTNEKTGKKSETRFRVLERFDKHTLLECFPLTGRTHQIRVHLYYLRLSIVMDTKYRGSTLYLSSLKPNYRLKPNRVERPLLPTLGLHAESLTIRHPVTSEPLTISAPIPKYMKVALRYLREYSGSGNSPNLESDTESEYPME